MAQAKSGIIDPEADEIFDAIDKDHSGTIEMKELVHYLLVVHKAPRKEAHHLLRSLDMDDHDGKISRAEWHRGWQAGLLLNLQGAAARRKMTDGSILDKAAAPAAASTHHKKGKGNAAVHPA